MTLSNDKSRIIFLDVLRGFTILLMFFFHFSFDLNYFGFIQVDIIHGAFWYILPRIIVFLFFFVAGFSLKVAHQKKIQWPKLLKRQMKLFGFAILISLVTYYLFPDQWIYFGTLHSLFLITFMSLPFIHFERMALLIALALFIPSIFWDFNLPFYSLPIRSLDYISPFPWWGASLLGIFASKFTIFNQLIGHNQFSQRLSFLGQHSLLIYLIHQPIFFGLIWLASRIAH